MNDFFMRFETDSVNKCYDVMNALPCNGVDDRIIIDPGSVTKVFINLCILTKQQGLMVWVHSS